MKQTNPNNELFDKYIAGYDESLFWFLYRATGSVEESTDLKQIVMEIAWNKAGTIRDLNHVKTWLFSIAYHHVLQVKTRKKKKTVDEFLSSDPEFSVENFSDGTDSTVDAILEKEERQLRLAVFGKMREEYRNIMFLHYMENVPLDQIAKDMGLKYSTTRVYLRRALEEAREIYKIMEGGRLYETKEKYKKVQERKNQRR